MDVHTESVVCSRCPAAHRTVDNYNHDHGREHTPISQRHRRHQRGQPAQYHPAPTRLRDVLRILQPLLQLHDQSIK
jgi:hypothetical protein